MALFRTAILLSVVTAVGCKAYERPTADTEQSPASMVLSRDSAITLARAELLRGAEAPAFMPDSIADVLMTDSSYHVMFKRVDWQHRRPGFGLVEVRRSDGRATRVPLR